MTPTASVVTDISQLDLSRTYTYADYLSWRFSEAVELIKGRVLRKMASPTVLHQQLSSRLHVKIGSYLESHRCQIFAAPFDVRLLRSTGNGDAQIRTVVQPDLCVVCDPGKLDTNGCLGAPDWIVEILSPSTARTDTITKFDLYAENGVTEYWIVYPGDRFVNAFVLNAAGEYDLAGTYEAPGPMPVHTLPGFSIEWAAIFREGK